VSLLVATSLMGCEDANEAVEFELGSDESVTRLEDSFKRNANTGVTLSDDASLGEELATAMDMLSTISGLLELEHQGLRQQASSGLIEIGEKELAAIDRSYVRVVDEHGDVILREFGKLMDDIYTDAEMRAAIDFYQTEEGQSFLTKQGQASAAGVKIGTETLAPMLEKIIAEELKHGQ